MNMKKFAFRESLTFSAQPHHLEDKYYQKLECNTYITHILYVIIHTLRDNPELLTFNDEIIHENHYHVTQDQMTVVKMISHEHLEEVNDHYNEFFYNKFNNDDLDAVCEYISSHSSRLLYWYIVYIKKKDDYLPSIP